MIAPRGLRVIDARAQRSGLEAGLTRMPFAAATLRRGTFDLVHACSLADAAVGARWSARTGRPAVWSVREAPDRRTLAARRRSFDLVRTAVGGVRSVVTPNRSVADACRRWLGVYAEVIDPRDAAAQEALYRRLVR